MLKGRLRPVFIIVAKRQFFMPRLSAASLDISCYKIVIYRYVLLLHHTYNLNGNLCLCLWHGTRITGFFRPSQLLLGLVGCKAKAVSVFDCLRARIFRFDSLLYCVLRTLRQHVIKKIQKCL